VTDVKITDGAMAFQKIATGAVVETTLSGNVMATDNINNLAVTTEKINDFRKSVKFTLFSHLTRAICVTSTADTMTKKKRSPAFTHSGYPEQAADLLMTS
jgi:hypothetical protein